MRFDFHRDAANLREAIRSAVRDVQCMGCEAREVRIEAQVDVCRGRLVVVPSTS